MGSIVIGRGGILSVSHKADRLLFARLKPSGKPDLDNPVFTRYSSPDGYVYALDLPPGRYVPIGAGFDFLGGRYWSELPSEVRGDWTVRVGSGAFAFLGQNALLITTPLDPLAALKNAVARLRLLAPPWKRPLIRLDLGYPERDLSREAEAFAMRSAARTLAGTFWGGAAESRLRALGDPPKPLTRGILFFKRPVPLRHSSYFSYQDLLDWGSPVPIRGGLEWRQERGEARVAVSFVPRGADAPSLDSYLKRLEEAGSPQDAHMAFKTYVRGRPAYKVLYTTYAYPAQTLLGSRQIVFKTLVFVVPGRGGYYLVHFRAKGKSFEEHQPRFERFVRYLVLSPPKKRKQ